MPIKYHCLFAGLALVWAAGTGGTWAQGKNAPEQRHPDVVAVKVTPRGANRFDFDVTMASPYDTPRRYADAFRVMDAEGKIFGERILLHDHAGEQPFTRELNGVAIPSRHRKVIVQGRDQKFGYGGRSVEVLLPGRR